jgi:ABC-type transport system substrate-binding protein
MPRRESKCPALKEKILNARTLLDEKNRLEIYKEIQTEIYEGPRLSISTSRSTIMALPSESRASRLAAMSS